MIDLKEQAGIAMNVRGQLSDPIADPKVTLGALAFANDLGRMLWRMKYGQDLKRSGLHRAALLLAKQLRDPAKFNRAKFTGITRAAKRAAALSGKPIEREASDVIERFASQVIVEWIADLCARCSGRGVIGRGDAVADQQLACPACGGARYVCVDEFHIPFAARPDGGGPMIYREIERCPQCHGVGRAAVASSEKRTGRQICPACHGGGRRAIDHAARARSLGVPLDQYRSHWEAHFHSVLAALDAVDGAANDTMRRKLQR
ncbi:hypothetical protein [Paraburkholderia aromaticivorans]|uniref:hypothetical protein n=1 Tax=Paraburkholderia aromaticivorans TaxID=2026199 RepID=UPI0014561D7F|nr:hypothetical protein [Paraburkholderia aromaticivorans]